MSLTTSINVTVQSLHTGTSGLGAVQDNINKSVNTSLVNGTAANQADLVYSTTGSFTGATSTTINIASGSLKDSFGAAFVFARFKALYIANNATSETNNTLSIGDSTNPITTWVGGTNPVVKLPAGGLFLLTAPLATAFAVTASTADELKVASGSGASGLAWDFLIVGSSA